jgi:uncharacterized protein YfbU (UPF0304 family)
MSVEIAPAECGEVIDILEMYSDLQRGCDALDDKSDIREYQINFPGFDGNHESKRVGYCRHFCGGWTGSVPLSETSKGLG